MEVEEESLYLLTNHLPQPKYNSSSPANFLQTTEQFEIAKSLKPSLWRTVTAAKCGEINQSTTLMSLVGGFMSRNRADDDDAITISLRNLLGVLIIVLVMWLLSYVLIMVQVIHREHFFIRNWPIFVPMWLGSLVGLVGCGRISGKICKGPLHLVTEDRRALLRYRGMENDQKQCLVDLSSLPLMRTLLFFIGTAIISLLLVFIGQILFYLWFVGVIELWHAIVPLNVLFIGYAVFMYLVKLFSLRSCFLLILAFIQFIIFISRGDHGKLRKVPWLYVTFPLWIIIVFSIFQLGRSIRGFFNGNFLLTTAQAVGLYGYLLSIILIAVGLSCIIYYEYSGNIFFLTSSYILWTIAVPIFSLSALLVILSAGLKLAETRGYPEPKILSRTPAGWTPTKLGGNMKGLWLIGFVKTKLPTPFQLTGPNTLNNNTIANFSNHRCSNSRDEVDFLEPSYISLQGELLGCSNSLDVPSRRDFDLSMQIDDTRHSSQARLKQIEMSPLGVVKEV